MALTDKLLHGELRSAAEQFSSHRYDWALNLLPLMGPVTSCVLIAFRQTMYITSITMDMVVYGSVGAKLALIISDQSEAIQKELLNMNLGVTILDGKGGWSGDHKNVILCVFKRNQIAAIKAAATAIDDKSVIIVCEAHEVLGEGFGAYSPDSL